MLFESKSKKIINIIKEELKDNKHMKEYAYKTDQSDEIKYMFINREIILERVLDKIEKL